MTSEETGEFGQRERGCLASGNKEKQLALIFEIAILTPCKTCIKYARIERQVVPTVRHSVSGGSGPTRFYRPRNPVGLGVACGGSIAQVRKSWSGALCLSGRVARSGTGDTPRTPSCCPIVRGPQSRFRPPELVVFSSPETVHLFVVHSPAFGPEPVAVRRHPHLGRRLANARSHSQSCSSSAGGGCGRCRCTDRCWPTTRHARRCDTRNSPCRSSTTMRLRFGSSLFLGHVFQHRRVQLSLGR